VSELKKTQRDPQVDMIIQKQAEDLRHQHSVISQQNQQLQSQ